MGWQELPSGESSRAQSVCGEGSSGGGGDVRICVRVAGYAPAALGRLRDQHPGALGVAGLAGCGGDDFGQFFDDSELLVAVEDVDGRENLDADVVAGAGGVG